MLSREEFYEIKGKIVFNNATGKEVMDFMEIVGELFNMVEEASCEDFFGTQGFEYRLGWDE
jgi:hypothetical protein